MQGCISYTLSPVHNNEYFAAYAKTLEEMGATPSVSRIWPVCSPPIPSYDLVKKLKETVSIPVDIHSHYTAGLVSMSILKGIEAGADITMPHEPPEPCYQPICPLRVGGWPCRTPTPVWIEAAECRAPYFAKLREKVHRQRSDQPQRALAWTPTPLYQVPGGMFSNMLQQLEGCRQGG